jgi:hypothetical protein
MSVYVSELSRQSPGPGGVRFPRNEGLPVRRGPLVRAATGRCGPAVADPRPARRAARAVGVMRIADSRLHRPSTVRLPMGESQACGQADTSSKPPVAGGERQAEGRAVPRSDLASGKKNGMTLPPTPYYCRLLPGHPFFGDRCDDLPLTQSGFCVFLSTSGGVQAPVSVRRFLAPCTAGRPLGRGDDTWTAPRYR